MKKQASPNAIMEGMETALQSFSATCERTQLFLETIRRYGEAERAVEAALLQSSALSSGKEAARTDGWAQRGKESPAEMLQVMESAVV